VIEATTAKRIRKRVTGKGRVNMSSDEKRGTKRKNQKEAIFYPRGFKNERRKRHRQEREYMRRAPDSQFFTKDKRKKKSLEGEGLAISVGGDKVRGNAERST